MSQKVGATDFEKIVVIGEGGYGRVFLVRKVGGWDHGRLYALKQVRKTTEMKRMGYFLNERNVLERVRGQPFLATLHYAFETTTDLNIVLDYVHGGDMFHQKLQRRRFSERRVQFYISELVLALEHLHKLKIVHRDIKLENILIDSGGHVVLTDFGFSKIISGDELQHWDTSGTVLYLAPEVIQRRQDQKHGYAIDWWALGVITFELLTGHSPFVSSRQERSTKEICRSILINTPVYPSTLSIEVRDFINSLLHKDPNKRLGTRGAEEVKAHPFFNGLNWDDLAQRKIPVPFLPCLKSDTDVRYFSEEFTNKALEEPADVKPCLCACNPGSSSSPVYSTSKIFRGFSYVGSPINPLDVVTIQSTSDATVNISTQLCRPSDTSSATSLSKQSPHSGESQQAFLCHMSSLYVNHYLPPGPCDKQFHRTTSSSLGSKASRCINLGKGCNVLRDFTNSLSFAMKRGSSQSDVRGNLTLSTISSTPLSPIRSEDVNVSRSPRSALTIGTCKTSPYKRSRSSMKVRITSNMAPGHSSSNVPSHVSSELFSGGEQMASEVESAASNQVVAVFSQSATRNVSITTSTDCFNIIKLFNIDTTQTFLDIMAAATVTIKPRRLSNSLIKKNNGLSTSGPRIKICNKRRRS